MLRRRYDQFLAVYRMDRMRARMMMFLFFWAIPGFLLFRADAQTVGLQRTESLLVVDPDPVPMFIILTVTITSLPYVLLGVWLDRRLADNPRRREWRRKRRLVRVNWQCLESS